MKNSSIRRAGAAVVTLVMILVWQGLVFAQDKVTIDKSDVKSWFQQNWMWVAAGALILILLIVAGGSRNRRKTTTIVKDDYGNVKSVTTTEVKE